jgi:hypothetical protein
MRDFEKIEVTLFVFENVIDLSNKFVEIELRD